MNGKREGDREKLEPKSQRLNVNHSRWEPISKQKGIGLIGLEVKNKTQKV